MKKILSKRQISILTLSFLLVQIFFHSGNCFSASAQTTSEPWESLSTEEYNAWKLSIEKEHTSSSETNLNTRAVYQNLFGNSYLEAYVSNDGHFTIGTTGGNPNSTTDNNKNLLFGHPSPWSSFTTIRIDDINYPFQASGPPVINSTGTEAISTMLIPYMGVRIQQIITLANNPSTNRYDCFKIAYIMTNISGRSRSMGARIMLDTELGSNDGSPFRIPGIGDVTTEIELYGTNIPQYWESFDNLISPSVISKGTLYRNDSEKPDLVQFCAWPGIYDTTWGYSVTTGRSLTGDSAVGIYYYPKSYNSGGQRLISTYYGISDFSYTDLSTPLSVRITAPDTMVLDAINGEYLSNPFIVSVYIRNTSTSLVGPVVLYNSLPDELSLISNTGSYVGYLRAGQESRVDLNIRADPQANAKVVNYTLRLTTDYYPDRIMNMSLNLPKVNGVQKLPIVFLPGIFGSTMISGADNVGIYKQGWPNLPSAMPAPQSELKLSTGLLARIGDPGYKSFVDNLNKIDGYKAYACPYDWRLSLQEIVDNHYLQDTIDLAIRESGQDPKTGKVIIVGHSMGGLVARQYIQSSSYRNDIDTLLMIGTPNNGSAFTYTTLEGGEIIDDDYKLFDPISFTPTRSGRANILLNAYNTIKHRVPSTHDDTLNSQQIFNFLYRDKEIKSLVMLGAQYKELLFWWPPSLNDNRNPLINKPGFESEIAELNSMSLDKYYQPLTSKNAGKVRTAIFYSDDYDVTNDKLYTVNQWEAEPTGGKGNRYPDGAVVFVHHEKSGLFDEDYESPKFYKTSGDATVPSHSATFGANDGTRWTLIPMHYGESGVHGKQVNEVDKLLRNFIFTREKIKLDASTISSMKYAANIGRTSRSLDVPTDDDSVPYFAINAIGNADISLKQNGQPIGITDKFGSNQTVITLFDPHADDYTIDISSMDDGLERVFFTIDYFNGYDVSLHSAEVAVTGSKDVVFTLSSDDIIINKPNYTVMSGKTLEGLTELNWEQVNNAEYYNIYSNEIVTDEFIFLGSTAESSYSTSIKWEDIETAYIYVEPVYTGGATDFLMVSVPNSDYTEAIFSVENAFGEAPLTVGFKDLSVGNISNWNWDFGDGGTSTEQNPSHLYTKDGIYAVTLTISGASGESTTRKSNYIVVASKRLTSLDLMIDSEVNVGEQINYELFGNYSDGSSEPIKSEYTFYSSTQNVVSVDGTTLTAIAYGEAVINVSYENQMTAQLVKVKDSIIAFTLEDSEIIVPPGTAFEDIDLPKTATIFFESGNTNLAPILWYEDTEPLYNANAPGGTRFMLGGIVDVSSDLLQEDVEPLTVFYTILFESSALIFGAEIDADTLEGGKQLTVTTRVTNTSMTTPEEVSTIIALYDSNDRLVNLATRVLTPVEGEQLIFAHTFDIPTNASNYSIKVFFWDRNYVPLTDFFIFR